MNWKVKLVLLFTNLRKPIDGEGADIKEVRSKSDKAAMLGARLFDKKTAVSKITAADANGIPLRIYQNTSDKNQRVIIYYHGGGFVLCSLDTHDNVCRRLSAMNDCIVVSVDYRLAPEHTFPSAHEDAFAAILWVKKNIDNYGGNPDDIVLAGDSAGGNISACMAHRCRKENLKLSAQVLIYPWIDGALTNASITRNGNGYLLTKESIFWFQKQYTPRKEDRLQPAISPTYEPDASGLAPTFILTAQYDPLVDDGFNYHKQLKDAGNTVRYKEYPGLVHGFINIPLVDRQAMKAFEDIKEFLSGIKA